MRHVLGQSRWRRSVRWLGLDRNPMRRPVDRIETAIRMGLVAALVLIAPPIAAGVGNHVKTAGLRAEHDQAPRRRDPPARHTATGGAFRRERDQSIGRCAVDDSERLTSNRQYPRSLGSKRRQYHHDLDR
jgi:hypothetical protein